MEEVYSEIKYSRVGFAFFTLAVGASLALVVFLPFVAEVRAAAFAIVILLAWRAHGHMEGVQALRLDCRRAMSVRGPRGEWRSGALGEGSFVAPWLVILVWRPQGARFERTLLLLPDMLDAEAMRKVRVIARWA